MRQQIKELEDQSASPHTNFSLGKKSWGFSLLLQQCLTVSTIRHPSPCYQMQKAHASPVPAFIWRGPTGWQGNLQWFYYCSIV